MVARRTLSLCSLMSLLFLVYFPLTTAKVCMKIDTCSCEMDDGTGVISLRDIDNKDGKPRFTKIPDITHPTYTFDWNPCTPIKNSGPCNGNNACQRVSPTDTFPAGLPNTTFIVDNKGNVVLIYGKKDYEDYTRYFKVTLKCDKTQTPGTFEPGITGYPMTPEESEYVSLLSPHDQYKEIEGNITCAGCKLTSYINPPVGLNIFGRSNPIGCPKQYNGLSRSLNALYFIVLSIQLG